MPHVKGGLAFVLLLAGITLVFLGVTRAQEFTPLGILVSIGAIGALLFTGGIWFGGVAPRTRPTSAAGDGSPVLFDVHGRLVSGPNAGQMVGSLFSETVRSEVDRHCVGVLTGRAARFPCILDGKPIVLEALPVRSADGAVVYGLFVPAGARTDAAEQATHSDFSSRVDLSKLVSHGRPSDGLRRLDIAGVEWTASPHDARW